jgi:DNA-binding GntR family transcriptional regulator
MPEMTFDAGDNRPVTRTEWADERVRAAIFRGDFGPGDPLIISTLARQLGLSATPLREALRRLASDGLVELHSHGSARVAQVDLREASEIYELRRVLEPMAIERAVANGDDAYRNGVRDAWQTLDVQRIAPAADHAAFHRALLSACDSTWLLRMATMLSDRAGLMIAVSLPGRPPNYNTAKAHRKLRDLALAGDAAGAADELARHLDRTIAALSVVLGEASTT